MVEVKEFVFEKMIGQGERGIWPTTLRTGQHGVAGNPQSEST
jgi:hypothetical protein